MIGAKNTPISFIIGSSANQLSNIESSNTLNYLESQCIEHKIKYDVKIQDSSDHASFNNAGINALTICYSDVSRIHTPNDTIYYIDSDSINQVYSIVKKEIYNYSYNKYVLLLYNPFITTFVVVISILIIIKTHKNIFRKSDL